jgi:hypothetical protein
VGPRAGLDTEVRGEILSLCRESNPDRPVVQGKLIPNPDTRKSNDSNLLTLHFQHQSGHEELRFGYHGNHTILM